MNGSPLNPALHGRLRSLFGHVRISNAGQEMIAEYKRDPRHTSGESLDVIYAGEQYQVCCPHCGDTRYRLYVNHRWGVSDKKGRLNLWLVHCFNENCFDSRENRERLYEMVIDIDGKPFEPSVQKGVVVDIDKLTSTMPGKVVRVDKLPEEHPAVQYLKSRFYSPAMLSKYYRVCYCERSEYMLANNRIVVPIYHKGQLKGWQARMIDKAPPGGYGPPKWYTSPGMPKSKLLYNLDMAKRFHTVVVTEGCGDVWSFGPMSVATFGASISPDQISLLRSQFKHGSVVLLWDPEAMDPSMTLTEDSDGEERRRVERRINKMSAIKTTLNDAFPGHFLPVVLPSGRDPGDLDKRFMRKYIENEAEKRGVEVSWELSP